MKFLAESQSIRDVFSKKKEILIPRFQREFVWDKDDALSVFWEDILDNIEYKNGSLCWSEYFLGNVVLIEKLQDKTEKSRSVVDGQQRLTAITIFLSALYDSFISVEEKVLAKKVYEYIVASDDDDNEITLLKTESPKPFFQMRIQARKKDMSCVPKSAEEKRLLDAYNFFVGNLSKKTITKEFKERFGQNLNYIDILKAIRDQVLNCTVVYVAVESMKDAYMIFEVLNAKGEPLNAVELIKNLIFKVLTLDSPIDIAAEKWKIIKNNVGTDEDVETFYRYFWLANYHFTNKKKLYQDFDDRIKERDYESFLDGLVSASDIYKKIINPELIDKKRIELLPVFYALESFSLFHVTQVRTILLSLLSLYKEKKITIKNLSRTLQFLENFHFAFSAVCSSRPSGLENRYSKYSLLLLKTEKSKVQQVLNKFFEEMLSKVPSYETFKKSINDLWYTDDKTKDKPLIQYILKRVERNALETKEFDISTLSIEHISSQSKGLENVGKLGNLLPLDADLNSKVGEKSLPQKIIVYKKSRFFAVKDFCTQYGKKKNWTIEDIQKRTDEIAYNLFYNICKFQKKDTEGPR